MKKILLGLAVIAVVGIAASMATASEVGTAVTINATVAGFAEWASATYTIAAGEFTGSITGANQQKTLTTPKELTLYMNATVTLTPTGTGSSGILTNGTETLTTSYQIQGDVDSADSAYIAAGTGEAEFFDTVTPNTYAISHAPGTGTHVIDLLVKAASGADAPDSGNYSCVVTMTASW